MLETSVSVIWNFVGFLTLFLKIFAFASIIRQPEAAFPFLDRQTKSTWLVISGLAVLCHIFFGSWGLTGLIGLVACAVYLVDILPKLNEMKNRR